MIERPQLGRVAAGPGVGDDLLQRGPGRLGVAQTLLQLGQQGGDVAGDLGQSEPVGHRQRLLGPAGGLVVPGPVGQGLGVGAEHPAAQLAVRLGRDQGQRLRGHGQDVDVEVGQRGRRGQRLQQPGPDQRIPVGRQVRQLILDQGHRPLRHPGGDRGRRRPHGDVDRIDGRVDPRIGDQLQYGEIVVQGLVRPAHRHRLLGRSQPRRQRRLMIMGGAGMPGQIGRGRPRMIMQRADVRGVQSDPLARQQILIDGLGQQRMPERVRVGAITDQDEPLDRVAQRQIELGRVQVGDLLQHLVADPAAGHGGRPDHLPCGRLELVQPQDQQVGKIIGNPAGDGPGGDQFLGEEGVSLGPVDHPGQLDVAQTVAQAGGELADRVVGQRAELEPLHRRELDPARGDRAQWMPPVQIVGAVGDDDRHRRRERPGEQETDQLQAGPVGPVDVLDHQQQRPLGGQVGHDAVHGLEQGAPIGLRRRPVQRADDQRPYARMSLDQPLSLLGRGQSADGLHERQVRQRAAAEVHALAQPDPPAGVDRGADRGRDDPRLADPGVTGQHHQPTRPAGRQPDQPEQAVQLARPPDERTRVEAPPVG